MGYKEEALDFLGITKWHRQGYTGKGIKILSDEKVCEKVHPDVISPNGFKSKRGHGDDVMSHIKLVAPDAMFIAYPFSGQFSETYKCNCAEYIKENKVHIFTTSELGGYPNKGKQQAIQDCINGGCIFFAAAGNEGYKGVNEEVKYEGYIAIGGVSPQFTGEYDKKYNPIYDWNELERVNYSSVGKELDYVTIAEILGVSGTSHCAPIFAAMVGLVQQFFIEKVGRRLTRTEMQAFINDNLIDTNTEGFDIQTGHGLFRLPNPSTIKISDYVTDTNVGDIDYSGFPIPKEEEPMKVVLTIDNHIVDINGEEKLYDVAPFIKHNRTFVPVQFLRDVGFNVEWNEATRQVIITK